MSDPVPSEPPKPTDCPHTHKHLVVERLTVKSPDGKNSVSIATYGHTAGVWVQNGDGQEFIGLIMEEGVGPYLEIRDPAVNGLPMAIQKDKIQVGGTPSATVCISFADLVEAIKQVQTKKD